MKKNILILFLLIQALVAFSQQWIPDLNKKYYLKMPDGSIGFGYCLLTVNDTLFIGGQFSKISDINASCIVKYSNGNCYPLNGGLYSTPFSLLYKNDTLFAAGSFMNADNKPGTQGLACWDGNNWSPVGINSTCAGCDVLELYQDKVYVGGNIPAIGSVTTGNVAYFNGTSWVNSSSNLPSIDILKTYSTDLLAGSTLGTGFMKFEGGSTWSAQPYGGISGSFFRGERDTINDLIYFSGGFYFVNGNIESHHIAIWDGFEWHSMGINAPVIWSLKMYNGYLYAGFISDTLNDGTSVNFIGRWDGNQWHNLGSGVDNGVNAMAEFHDTLFVGGGFTIAGGDSAHGLARWYMPDTGCYYLQPTIHTLALQDTFYISQGHADVQFFNNNTYVQTWQWNFGDLGTANTQNPIHSYTNDSTYTITVTVTDNGCIKTDTAHIVVLWGTPVEMYTKENLNFKVYPNPTGGDFNIECTLPQNKTGKVKAFRNTGTELGEHTLESGLNNFIMPSSNWKDSVILVGVYIENRQVLVEKVVKTPEH